MARFEFTENPLTNEAVELIEEQTAFAFAGETQSALELGLSSAVMWSAGEVAQDGASSH